MKKSCCIQRMLILVVLCCVTALFLLACNSGLEPAGNSDKTVFCLQLGGVTGTPSGSSDGRALVQGGGYLYIQTGLTLSDAKIYGPFDVVPSVAFETTEIPAGDYPFMALVYVKNPDTNAHTSPIIPADQTSAAFLTALQTLWLNDTDTRETASFALLKDVSLRSNQTNTVSSTLLPVTTTVAVSSAYLTGTANTVTKRFLKLTGVSAGFATSGNTLMKCSATTGSVSAIMYAVGLYNADGTLVKYFSEPRVISAAAGTDYTATWNGGDVYYMYFEFAAANIMLSFSTAP